MEHEAHTLLEMFGTGQPTPGSGSAAALQALVSAKLIRTVTLLTAKPKFKPRYDTVIPELDRIRTDIDERIYPLLERLFQNDTDQFTEYIEAYKAWEVEKDERKKPKLHKEKLNRLAVVTNNAVEIAQLGVKLAGNATYVFRNGFVDVRGDSAAALNAASSAVGSCLTIIELNLLSFEWDDWASDIREAIVPIRASYEKLLATSSTFIQELADENLKKHRGSFDLKLVDFRSGRWEETVRSEVAIEKLAREVQNTLWMYRNLIWPDEIPGDYLDALDPRIAIEKLLGFDFKYDSLGRFIDDAGYEYETAGLIDKENKIIRISSDMRATVRNFTSAHELGHALMHKESGLHRDRPLDGSSANKDIREWQADKFAAFFLMPAKLVKAHFQSRFGDERFIINENTVFKLNEEQRPSEFKKKVRDIDGLAKYLASQESYQGRVFLGLADTFKVSVGAMAIRLKELDLVVFS